MKNQLLVALTFVGLVLIFSLLLAVPTMLLWNWLMVSIFKLAYINIFEAWGVNILCSILFEGTHSSISKTN